MADAPPAARLDVRAWLVWFHRWTGLLILLFVFQVGLTGAIMAFHHELDHLFLGSWAEVEPEGEMRPLAELTAAVEAAYPGVTIDAGGDNMADHPRESVVFYVTSPEGAADPVTEVFVNPYTAEVLGGRAWGEVAWGGQHVMPMIYVMHHSLLMGDFDGWGFWIMGVVVLLWIADHAVSLWISIPRSGPFWKAMTVKWRGSAYRINFDVHRAGGLFLWVVLLVIALTGASWNAVFFERNWFYEALHTVAGEPTPYATEGLPERAAPLDDPAVDRDEARVIVADRMEALGIEPTEYWLYYYPAQGVWDAWIKANATGTSWYNGALDGETGAILAERAPGRLKAVDVVADWVFPLHSGQAFGLAGRVLICLSGLFTCALCVTGFVIWRKKAAARRASAAAAQIRALKAAARAAAASPAE